MDSGVEFVAVDNPHANKLTVHILAAVAEHEREMISERTKAALQAGEGAREALGQPKAAALGTAAGKAVADQRAATEAGLNASGPIEPPKGASRAECPTWSAPQPATVLPHAIA